MTSAVSTSIDSSGSSSEAPRKRTTVQMLRDTVEKKLWRLLAQNPLRTDFQKHYEEIVAEYNREKDRVTIERTFEALLELVQELEEEQSRAVREGLDEESLAVFDLLKKPDLSGGEIRRIKQVAVELLRTLKAEKLRVDQWREKEIDPGRRPDRDPRLPVERRDRPAGRRLLGRRRGGHLRQRVPARVPGVPGGAVAVLRARGGDLIAAARFHTQDRGVASPDIGASEFTSTPPPAPPASCPPPPRCCSGRGRCAPPPSPRRCRGA